MATSMRERGVLQPLTVTADGFILSGHRRYCAATVAGLAEVPVIVEQITSNDPDFARLLVMHNQQRQKTIAEVVAEQVVESSGEDAHRALVQHRIDRSRKASAEADSMSVSTRKKRSGISPDKMPMLAAVVDVLQQLRDFWPLSLRTVHYNLLNDAPERNARTGLMYENNETSYSDLSDLVTRARLAELVPWDAIEDETRPESKYRAYRSAGDFIRDQFEDFMSGYWRDLLQSQPDHIEVVGEKNTLLPMIRPICADYTVPLTIGRGYCSLPPRKKIFDRWKKSGKNKLVLIVLSDHDPDGCEIADSLVGSLRDDFLIPRKRIIGVRAALTAEQCDKFRIPADVQAKVGSTNYRKFVAKYGTGGCELEAVPPKKLQQMLRDAIESVLDLEAFRSEQDREIHDANEIETARQRAMAALGPMA